MTNAEKFLKEGIDDRDFAKALSNYIADGGRKITDREDIRAETLYFLTDEAKPTLTEDERVILRNIDKKYKYIFRATDNELYLCKTKGIRYYDEDDREIGHDFLCYKHLFQFLKERRRIRDTRITGGKICYELKKI